MGRILPDNQYVDITVSLSLFTQISTFLSSIIAVTVGLSKQEDEESAQKTIHILQAFLLRSFIILSIGFLMLAPFIMKYIHTPAIYALPIVLMMFFTIPITIISGYLNGKNKLIHLGMVIAISAVFQFIIALTVGLITGSGIMTMLSMTLAQILAIFTIYYAFRREKVPRLGKSIKISFSNMKGKELKSLLKYTFWSGIGVMIISLVQIADLLLLRKIPGANAKEYTDIYVISRVVFFAGTIMIWPFLAKINVRNLKQNNKHLLNLFAIFTVIALFSGLVMLIFSHQILGLLFGTKDFSESIVLLSLLSILYKYLLLILTAIILYLTVLHSYKSVIISVLFGFVLAIFSFIPSVYDSLPKLLYSLNIIAILLLFFSILILFLQIKKPQN